jgi:hypothetical protein
MYTSAATLSLSTLAMLATPSIDDPIAKLVAAGLSVAVTIGVLVKMVFWLQSRLEKAMKDAADEKMALLEKASKEKEKLADILDKSRADMVVMLREVVALGQQTARASESASDANREIASLVRDLRQSREHDRPMFRGNADGN